MNIALEETRLGRLSGLELRERYAALFGERTDSRNRHYLTRRILWRMQMRAEGGLSERARRRAEELGNLSDLRQSAPTPRSTATVESAPAPMAEPATATRRPGQPKTNLPPPGAVLIRRYLGRDHHVLVRGDGFEWEGTVYRSLSAVAKAITGSHWSGNLFFNIAGHQNARTRGRP